MQLNEIADSGLRRKIAQAINLAENRARIDTEDGTGAGAEKLSDRDTGQNRRLSDGLGDKSKANKTEIAALELLTVLAGGQSAGWTHEGRTFRLLGGVRSYTPDWVLTANRVAVEVKAEYIKSRDSGILFDAARNEYPDWTWVWLRFRDKGLAGKRVEIKVWRAKQCRS